MYNTETEGCQSTFFEEHKKCQIPLILTIFIYLIFLIYSFVERYFKIYMFSMMYLVVSSHIW